MARIRTIKPEFWTDEKVVALSPFARLLFIGMWNFVDDDGRAEYAPLSLKLKILPADSVDVPELLGEIRGNSLINVYTVDGKEYFEVCGFSKHQKIDKRTASKLPPPPNSPEFPRTPPTEGNGKEGKGGEEEKGGADAPTEYAFSGDIIRLTEKHLDDWRGAYPAVPDIIAELQAADAYYADNPPKDGKWFFSASNWLKRAHEGEMRRRAESREAEDRIYRGVQ